jgi:hypothetical protein
MTGIEDIFFQLAFRSQCDVEWTVDCKCGSVMELVYACRAYQSGTSVSCNRCSGTFRGTEVLFHCPKDKNAHHLHGFDYCTHCARDVARAQYRKQEQEQRAKYCTVVNINRNRNRNRIRNRENKQLAEQQRSNRRLEETLIEKQQEIERLRKGLKCAEQKRVKWKSERRTLAARLQQQDGQIIALTKEISKIQSEHRKDVHEQVSNKLDVIAQQKDDIRDLKLKLKLRLNVKSQSQLEIGEEEESSSTTARKYKSNSNSDISDNDNDNDTNDAQRCAFQVSPTLAAIFTQKFLVKIENSATSKKTYVGALHNEILGMTMASLSTIKWFRKNCKIYVQSPGKSITNNNNNNNSNNNSNVFSFNSFALAHHFLEDDDDAKIDELLTDNGMKRSREPLVNMSSFDLHSVQRLNNLLKTLATKYESCKSEVQQWNDVIEELLVLNANTNTNTNTNANNWNQGENQIQIQIQNQNQSLSNVGNPQSIQTGEKSMEYAMQAEGASVVLG